MQRTRYGGALHGDQRDGEQREWRHRSEWFEFVSTAGDPHLVCTGAPFECTTARDGPSLDHVTGQARSLLPSTTASASSPTLTGDRTGNTPHGAYSLGPPPRVGWGARFMTRILTLFWVLLLGLAALWVAADPVLLGAHPFKDLQQPL